MTNAAQMHSTIGLDIGGANLKAAHSSGTVASMPFALWQRPVDLPVALRALLDKLPRGDRLAFTMTGELCDCFATKADGVNAIIDAVEGVADGRPIRVLQTDGRLVATRDARTDSLKTAAANWMAWAVVSARWCPNGSALLIDIGSTTTDIIPVLDGSPVPQGRTDTQRLAAGELVYTGIRRTPLCALLREVPWQGRTCRTAAEVFATTLDAYLTIGELSEDPDDCNTADGRPATCEHATARLARMICADCTRFTNDDAREIAVMAVSEQSQIIGAAFRQVAGSLRTGPTQFVISGSGEFLARRIIDSCTPNDAHIVAWSERFGSAASEAACAFALSLLATDGDFA